MSLATLLEQVRLGALHGLNVTIPHKQRVIPYLDELTPTAKAIGAVNTIWLRNGRLHGDNTDAPGFMRDVERFLGHHSGKRPFALILGAGGSARAVVYALASAGWGVTVAARQLTQAKALTAAMVEHVSGPLTAVPLTVEALRGIIPGLLVNCTPLGMAPDMNASPWPDGLPLPENGRLRPGVQSPRNQAGARRPRCGIACHYRPGYASGAGRTGLYPLDGENCGFWKVGD